MKTGSLIKVRDWEGIVLTRQVVEIAVENVFVCTQEEWDKARQEGREPLSVAFPKDAIVGKVV
jgi:hypothetical protein